MMFFEFDIYNIVSSLLISMLIQAVFFTIAYANKTDKVTDFSYSLSFISMTAFFTVTNKAYNPIQLIMATFIILWGLRLGAYLLTRIIRIGKDKRFDDKRENFIRFLGFWILQASAVWLVMMPSVVFLTRPAPESIGVFTIVGIVFWILGFIIEVISDHQKFQFKSKGENDGRWIEEGLWKYSRHPNYFGETILWWALFIMAIPSLNAWLYLTVIGPIFITLLLLFVSGIPLLEKSAEKQYGLNPEYQDYKRRTSIFVLLPPQKKVIHD
ncbi:DUF1295 domain-containing protein [Oceanispirochaeta crateris]|uniref:DUF1295 domain-containing protein n=1 Tax=Oceanispirochaeta crateris TaxID=2518645 RepID=A0A5C1QNC3_9SPIO|nr:DUF1295 domain-containing protein [Oceanispirochaeta crateris]QEN08719.1 DUF1295 domain-containing protein [Oceanispirochaeta crateris]